MMMKDLLVDLSERLEPFRHVAVEWHGGQMSPLYALASTGIVSDPHALLAETERCADMAVDQVGYWERAELAEMIEIISGWLAEVE